MPPLQRLRLTQHFLTPPVGADARRRVAHLRLAMGIRTRQGAGHVQGQSPGARWQDEGCQVGPWRARMVDASKGCACCARSAHVGLGLQVGTVCQQHLQYAGLAVLGGPNQRGFARLQTEQGIHSDAARSVPGVQAATVALCPWGPDSQEHHFSLLCADLAMPRDLGAR